MPHQWLEGNLPVSAKCLVCDKPCGSVLRLQDCKCIWCKATVHTGCKGKLDKVCSMGPCSRLILPPTNISAVDLDEMCKARSSPRLVEPLLVFVNSKSGDNQGVKMFRKFKRILNPAQVFDLIRSGPHCGFVFYFRILYFL